MSADRRVKIITQDAQLLRPGAAPLDWSAGAYKMTLGIGALGMTAIMADLWKPRLPFWIIAIVTLTPLLVFIFITLNGFSPRAIRRAHVLASIWYFAAATFVIIAMCLRKTPSAERGMPLMVIFLAIGAIPCALVLTKAIRGRYCVENQP